MSAKSATPQAASATVSFAFGMQSAEAAPHSDAVPFAFVDGPGLKAASQPNV